MPGLDHINIFSVKKPEWLFVGVLLLIAAYFSYRYLTRPQPFEPLQLVPTTSVAVYQTDQLPERWAALADKPYWQDLLRIEEIVAADQLIRHFDSLMQAHTWLAKEIQQKPVLLSLHVTGSQSAGLLYYMPGGLRAKDILKELLQYHTGKPARQTTRQYNGFAIYELRSGELEISAISYKDYLIFSKYGYLVEDVVRNINAAFKDNFFANHSELTHVSHLQDDGGDLYINGRQLSAFWHTFLPPGKTSGQVISGSAFYDVAFNDAGLLLSGFLFAGNDDFTSVFRDQEAGEPQGLLLVPNDAARVMSIRVSDVPGWQQRWLRYFNNGSEVSAEAGLLAHFLDGDITYAELAGRQPQYLLLSKITDAPGVLNFFNKKAEELAKENGDTVYYESFAGHDIGLIEQADLPATLLGEPFRGFADTYFTIHDDYLVLASSAVALQNWLRALQNDEVWGRQTITRELITETLGETTFALIFRNPQAWNLGVAAFNPKHRQWWQQNKTPIKQFGLAVFQFTNLDNRFYSACNLIYEPRRIETGRQQFNEVYVTQLASRPIIQPRVVRNHRDQSFELLVQDSLHNLLLLDKQGEVLWQRPLPAAIRSQIYQIDYYRNRKLQYLFTTDSAVYLIDRNGDDVEGYPVQVHDFAIQGLYLFDYDHDRHYRFLLTDAAGNLRLYDQQMNLLPGWDPLAMQSALSDQIRHVRVRGKDRIVIGLQNGTIDLRNRRGELQPGFPLELLFNLVNPLHFVPGSTFAESRFFALSQDGLLVSFDLNGKLYASKQLYQPANTARFTLVPQAAGNDFVIARQDINRLALLDTDGNVLFEKDYEDANPKEVQFYAFSLDKHLYIVRDTHTGHLYLYNNSGDLINATELYSDYKVAVIYRKSQAKCYIYTAHGQTISQLSFAF